ncbi:MAG: hypothetical protein HY648_10145, partial [Acidobacteria bacterium]|nr:hypothetical protein [Acidobacteriota bacterium]
IYRHCGAPVFDYAVLNSAPIASRLEKKYRARQSQPVKNDIEELERLGIQVIMADLVSKGGNVHSTPNKIRHDPDRLASVVLEIAAKHQRRRTGKRRPARAMHGAK